MHTFYSTGEVRKVFPGGWDEADMLTRLNEGFIDFRNKKGKAVVSRSSSQ